VATRRRTTRRTSPGTRRRRSTSSSLPPVPVPSISVSPDVTRSIVGICLLVLGAVTLIALALPGQGALTDWWRDSIAPWFETGRWLLPFLLLGAGWYLEWGPGTKAAAGADPVGPVAFVGSWVLEILDLNLFGTERGGGRIGRFLATTLQPLLTGPGAFVICLAILAVGLMLAFNVQLKELLHPVTKTAGWVGATTKASLQREPGEEPAPAKNGKAKAADKGAGVPVMDAGKAVALTARHGRGRGSCGIGILDEPATDRPGPDGPDVWTAGGEGVPRPPSNGHGTGNGVGLAAPARAAAVLTEDREPTALESLQAIDWTLPPIELLEVTPVGRPNAAIDHASNTRRIEEKLLSFAIPAKVVAVNSGPVVTQYEVKPEHHVKVSRIEALADDLAMALSARSIRIEAPIPGRDVVGIEIPNAISEVVGFRPLVEETNMLAATSPRTSPWAGTSRERRSPQPREDAAPPRRGATGSARASA
jgi:hypothetical protein